MTSYDELATKYASRIRSAAVRDQAAGITLLTEDAQTKTASAKAAIISESATAHALKEFADAVANMRIDGRAATTDEQFTLVTTAAEKLGVRDPQKLRIMMKEASNDHFVGLVSYWSGFWADLGL